jgi:hypothetical protein
LSKFALNKKSLSFWIIKRVHGIAGMVANWHFMCPVRIHSRNSRKMLKIAVKLWQWSFVLLGRSLAEWFEA